MVGKTREEETVMKGGREGAVPALPCNQGVVLGVGEEV